MVRVATGPFFFRLPFASPQGPDGIADRLPAVAYGYTVFSEQSAGSKNRALSLERDFIDVVGLAAP